MPIGIITDVAATSVGGLLGCILGSRLSERWKGMLNSILGVAALVMGIILIIRVRALSAAVLSLILGAILGELLRIEDRVNALAAAVTKKLAGGGQTDAVYLAMVSAALVLFCFGGTGWYGAFNEGLTGDGSILVTKAILDCVSACIFAAILGKIIPCLCLPQLCVYLLLFAVSGLVSPFVTPDMIADFSAVGGTITMVAGLRLTKIKTDMKVLNLLPSLVIAFFISSLWARFIS